jgi:hypothetical protein
MKHHVRREGWLAFARERYRKLRSGRKPKDQRPLKYFTFCAESAIDVLLFDIENIIPYDPERGFESVFFFTRTLQAVIETRKRIPRATGFPGDFVKVVLVNDPDENDSISGLSAEDSPEDEENFSGVRELETRLITHRNFVGAFPFDIINLDLEEFLFKPRDPIPGKVINAFRRVFAWQQKPLQLSKKIEHLNEWTLMLTTQIGPANMSDVYLNMLTAALESNLRDFKSLLPLLHSRTGTESVVDLRNNDFETFFELSMPKMLLKTLMENDWYVDPARGVVLFRFEREHANGRYSILHLVMDVLRKNPPVQLRPPGEDSAVAIEAYQSVVHSVFETPVHRVSEDVIDRDTLRADLDRIAARAHELYPDE